MSTYPPYGSTLYCAKCGEPGQFRTRWIPDSPDYLERRCPNCDYRWAEATADAASTTSTKPVA